MLNADSHTTWAFSRKRPDRRHGWTLLEVLVVISVILLLISVLLPSLTRACASARMTTCASHLHQLALGIQMYANSFAGLIPRGPDPAWVYDFGTSAYPTNQLWIGDKPSPGRARQYTGLGLLLRRYVPDSAAFFCPSDDTFSKDTQLAGLGRDGNTWCSYFYRHLFALPPGFEAGRLDSLGTTHISDRRVRIEALVMDANSFSEGEMYHTNHLARRANVLYRDGSVRGFDNRQNAFTLTLTKPFENIPLLLTIAHQVFINGDVGYLSSPEQAPRLGGLQ